MLLKYKVLIPAVSVVTAGGASYPLLFSGSNSTFATGNSTALKLEGPEIGSNNKSLGINSSQASSLSVSTLNSTPNTSMELKAESSEVSIDTQSGIMQSDSLPIQNLQGELQKENQVGSISEEQMKEFQEALAYVKESQQKFKMLSDKVSEYRTTLTARGDISATRTFHESGTQALSQQHREALMKFYEMYAKLENFKSDNLLKLNSFYPNSNVNKLFLNKKVTTEVVLDSLQAIDWKEKNIRIFQDKEKRNNWGWGVWDKNPFRVFFVGEGIWKNKVEKFQDALDIAKLNRKDIQACSSPASASMTERDQAIQAWCKGDNERFAQLIEGYKSEIELDIASWLLDQMKLIQTEREESQ
ncbi:hypothetical protein [Candidatus Mycoplasma haematominutum]|uniref:Uncharacterized protein n=1 Tax=Candidatus Mycoplasma haematominutum 'Birmingham 1' TaxID=1116213 RepID=G8C3I4_9MOLU|nr:hypothetical protein [Candidatus Mycoplasma haematominutum]CCE66882.1 hypothetical protein MHM_03640 [Candidatus Mycoplasma haematominutum 'Birmingham 1']